MKRREAGLEPELVAFLEFGRVERHVPLEMRARVLARGRAIVAAGGAMSAARPLPVPVSAPLPAARRHLPLRIALAASIALVGAAAGAVGAVRSLGAHHRSVEALQPERPQSPALTQKVAVAGVGGLSHESVIPPTGHSPRVTPSRSGRGSAKADPFTAELELLQRAHAAYTRRDFAVALTLAAEHARRYPQGPLAEQREALRVRSLAASGQAEEARRASAIFAIQFPRSVLLPRVSGEAESGRP
jgi:hypothetical protein